MRYKITFSYDGSCFYGYERQPGLKSVQGEIENILSDINDSLVTIHSSGRTDKGVHALMQVAHFDLDKDVSLYGLKKVLNKRLNGDVYINNVTIVSDSFHARYDVLDKTYCYYINILDFDVFRKNYVYQYCKSLDINLMKEASKMFIGTHDFRSFCKDDKVKENCVRTIKSISVEESNGIIVIKICADGFLRKMVRNIVGLLIEVGSYKKDINDVLRIINSKGYVKQIKSAPGCGLYLESVNYKDGVL